MILGSKGSRAYFLLLMDLLINFISVFLSGAMRHGFADFVKRFLGVGVYASQEVSSSAYISVMVFLLIVYGFLYVEGKGKSEDLLSKDIFGMLQALITRQALLTTLILSYLFVTKQGVSVSRMILVVAQLIALGLEILVRLIVRAICKFRNRSGNLTTRLLLITNRSYASIALKRSYAKIPLCRISAVVLLDGGELSLMGLPVISGIDGALGSFKQLAYDEVLVDLAPGFSADLGHIILEYEQMGIPVNLNMDTFGVELTDKQISELGPHHVVRFENNSVHFPAMLLKRCIDLAGGMLGVLCTLILTVIFGPFICLYSGKGVFDSVDRIGKNGRRFTMYRFRITDKNDNISPVGNFLRVTCLEHFPKFWNVVRGDMSLVGTRPPSPEEYLQYEKANIRTLSIKPGVTGMWQIDYGDELQDINDVLRLDLAYIDRWSIGLDFKLMLKTIMIMFKGRRKLPSECRILGVRISVVDMQETVALIRENLRKWAGKYICVANVHTTVMSYENERLKDIENGAVLTLPDGRPLSVEAEKRGFQIMERVTGPDLMRELFEISPAMGYRHFFYGSSEATLKALREKLEDRYPGIIIAGMISPPYRELEKQEDEAFVKSINEAEPDIVWVGLGAPKQEFYMAEHEDRIKALMIGVGAGFDYHADTLKRAPGWMQRLSLEWLYRLLQDPKRLMKRYLDTNFKFLRLVVKDR